MSLYTIRVELHNATSQSDYQNLHQNMQKKGFSTTIKADNGALYHLPTAEYNIEGNYSISQVQQAACDAAKMVGKKYTVLVTKGISRSWFGLELAKHVTP